MKMDPYCGEFRISLATFNLDMTTNIAMEQNIDFRISTQCFTEFMEAVYKYAVEIWTVETTNLIFISMVVRRLSYFWIKLPEKGCLRCSLLNAHTSHENEQNIFYVGNNTAHRTVHRLLETFEPWMGKKIYSEFCAPRHRYEYDEKE